VSLQEEQAVEGWRRHVRHDVVTPSSDDRFVYICKVAQKKANITWLFAFRKKNT